MREDIRKETRIPGGIPSLILLLLVAWAAPGLWASPGDLISQQSLPPEITLSGGMGTDPSGRVWAFDNDSKCLHPLTSDLTAVLASHDLTALSATIVEVDIAPDGSFYLLQSGGSRQIRIMSPDLSAETGLLTPGDLGVGAIRGVAFDAAGDLWVLDDSVPEVVHRTVDGAVLPGGFALDPGVTQTDIVMAPDGTLWISWKNSPNAKLDHFEQDGSPVAGFEGIEVGLTHSINAPSSMAILPGGEIAVIRHGNDEVFIFEGAAQILEAAPLAPLGLTDVQSMDVGPGGNPWLLDTVSREVHMLSRDASTILFSFDHTAWSTRPSEIDVGSDGTLYLSDRSTSQIHALTPDGTSLQRTLTDRDFGLGQIDFFDVAPDGTMWAVSRPELLMHHLSADGATLLGTAPIGLDEANNLGDLTAASDGSLWLATIVDSEPTLVHVDETGAPAAATPSIAFASHDVVPMGLAVLSDGDLLVLDSAANELLAVSGPQSVIARAVHLDIAAPFNGNLASAGDQVVLIFDRPIIVAGTLEADDFSLVGWESSLGDFTVNTSMGNPHMLSITLGEGANLWIPGKSGSSSAGIDISATIESGDIIDAETGATLGPSAHRDIEYNFSNISEFVNAGGGSVGVSSGADYFYTEHVVTIASGAVPEWTEFHLSNVSTDVAGVVNAVEIGPPGLVFGAAGSTLTLEYTDFDTQNCAGGDELQMKVHQLVDLGDGDFAWVPIPGPQTVDAEANTVTVPMSGTDLLGTDGETGLYATLPIDLVDDRSFYVRRRESAGSSPNQIGPTSLGSGDTVTHTAVFEGSEMISSALIDPVAIAAGDLDGDSDCDVVVASASGDDTQQSAVLWLRNTDGLGTLGPQRLVHGLQKSPTDVAVGDLDADGDMDIVFASGHPEIEGGEIAWLENLGGAGSFGAPKTITAAANGVMVIHLADVDGDGDTDVLSASVIDNRVSWFENTGTGAFGPEQVVSATAHRPRSICTADVDEDGDLDVLSASTGTSDIEWHENTDGAGTFAQPRLINGNAYSVQGIDVADLDGDGDPDVVAAIGAIDDDDGTLQWFENTDRRGSFGPPRTIAWGQVGASSIHAVDFDLDGDQDLVATSDQGASISWYENIDGAGTFQLIGGVASNSAGGISVVPADMDGDSDPETLYASVGANRIGWHRNTTDPDAVLTVSGDARFSGHQVVMPGYVTATDGIAVTVRTSSIFERNGFPMSSGAIFTIETSSDLTELFDLTLEFRPDPALGDIVTFDQQESTAEQLRLVQRLDLAQPFAFTGDPQLNTADSTVTTRNVTPLTRTGLGVYGLVADPAIGVINSNGSGGGAFCDSSTWEGGVAPGPTDTACVVAGDTVLLDADCTLTELIIDPGGELQGGSSTLTIADGGTLNNQGVFTCQSGNVTVGATGHIEGTVHFNDLLVPADALLIENGNGSVEGRLNNQGTIRNVQAIGGAGPVGFGLTGVGIIVTDPGTLTSLEVDRVDANTPNANGQNLLTGVYWDITPAGGGYSADLTLPYDNLWVSDPHTARWDGETWEISRTSFDAVTVTQSGVTAFSQWTVNDTNVVPVELSLFSAH